MSTISIRLTENEKEMARKYAESKGINISQLFKDLLYNALEDEYDLEICKEYLERKAKDEVKIIPFDEAVKDWGI